MLMEAMRDGDELARWAEPNTVVLNDEKAERAVLAALSARSESDAELGTPMLRPCDPSRQAVPLVGAIVEDKREFRGRCDRCRSKGRPQHRLWVPAGASVAELVCCWHCRDALDFAFTGLVWR